MNIESESVNPEALRDTPAWRRLEDQLGWYDAKSVVNQRRYKQFRMVQVAIAILLPLISMADPAALKWYTAVLGALIALLEAVQHLQQYGTLWVQYRSIAEQLKHEKFLFLSGAGPYRDLATDQALPLLAERVEEHVSTEHARWVRTSEKLTKDDGKTPPAKG